MGNKSLLAAAAILLLCLSPLAVLGQTQITFFTDHEIGGEGGYSGYTSIDVSGNVNPPPASGSVLVTTTNPVGVVVASDSEPLQPGTGMFEDLVIAGCTAAWIDGTYTITVALSGSPQVVASTTFGYIVNDPALDNVTLSVSPQSVSGSGTVTISGTVAACGGSAAQASVLLSVKNPSGLTVFSDVVQPIAHSSPEDGNYSAVLTVGGSAQWVPGTYAASAFFTSTQSVGTPATAGATFLYTGNATQSSSASSQSASASSAQSSGASTTSQTNGASSSAQSSASSSAATTTAPAGAAAKSSGAPLIPYVVAIAIAAGVAGSFVGLRGRQKGPKT